MMKLGEYELNNIYCADCYEAIKKIPDNSIDCIYTDIPYEYADGGCSSSEIAMRMRKVHKGELLDNGIDLTKGIDYTIFNEFIRVMKKINCFIWCSKDQILPILSWFNENTDCTYNILTWNKSNPSPMCNGNWLPDIEYCLYFNRKSKLNDGYDIKSKWYISKRNKSDKDHFEHPTIKPLPLVERHLLHTTQPNDIVLDTFMGSGTTAVACKNIGRNFIGFELSERWHKIACDRLNNVDANGQMSLFTI